MQKYWGLLMSLTLSAIVGLMGGSPTHAGSITLSVDLNGVVIFTATSTSPDQAVDATLTAVNTALGAHGSAYMFTGLEAQSNYTGDGFGSLETTFQLNTSGPGTTAAVLSIDTVQSGFLAPVGADGMASSSAGGSFDNTNGSLSYTSNYQGANLPTLVFPIAGVAGSYSGDTGAIPIGTVPSGFELSNHFLISINKTSSSFLGGTGGVVVTAACAVPEPSSIVILLTGLGLPMFSVFGMIRRHRSAA